MDTPAVTPVTIPEAEVTDTLRELAVQVPPGLASVNVNDEPTHMAGVPLMAAGSALMVRVAVVLQPVGSV